jgi:uncharacterized protein (DUF2236 family)
MSRPQNKTILGPDSLMWRYFGDTRVLYLLPSTTTVQVAHPSIGAGVEQHSVYKTDPWGRLERSLSLLWPVLYNTPQGVQEYGNRLREMHRNIKGTDFQGNKYHALNPELYTWVHITTYYGMLALAEFNGDKLTDEQKQQLYDEWLQFGRQMGIRDQDMPADIPSYWTYLNSMIENKLTENPATEYVMHKTYYTQREKHPNSTLSDRTWKILQTIQGNVIWKLKIGFFPESYRKKFGLKWSKLDQLQFNMISLLMRGLWPLLPERARWVGPAYSVICDARENPEKYHDIDLDGLEAAS